MALNISSNIVASEKGRELVQHGSALFPIACYAEDLSSYSVAWHWHEEFEYVLCTKGPLHVDVNKTRLTLQTGQGVFINSGVLHAVEQAPEGTALLHSGVFHPRLVGGMDTIFWQKLIRPMTQPDAPPFFLLDGLVPWQKQVLDCLHESWKAVSDEPFDYENRVRYYLSLALRLLSTQCVGGRTKVSQQEQIASERMKQMLRFVEEHYAEELTVQLIAGSVALSESACLRSFRQMLGITPIQYVKQYRVEKAAELAKAAGARRCIPLKVSGPFHTRLMHPAGDALAKRFASEHFGEMETPVLFNCLGREKADSDSIPALLEKQVQSSVYMEDTLRRLGELGVTDILEVGPGKALSGFVKKTLGADVHCTAVETAEELEAFLTSWKEAQA